MQSRRQWSSEVDVRPERARKLVENQFPQLRPARVEFLGAGWDNTAFLVNGAYVFRFPRRHFAVQFLEAEGRLLPHIACRLPLPVPNPLFFGSPTDTYPWPFSGYNLLPGRTACTALLSDEKRGAIAEPLGHFMAALHYLPIERHFAGPDTIRRLDLPTRIPQAQQNLEKLTGAGSIENSQPFQAILDGAPVSYTPRTDTLVHGDLYARHLLIGPQDNLAGVIDWGDAHWGDPALNLAIVWTVLPPESRAAFFHAYGPVDPSTMQVARLRALWHSLLLLDYSVETGQQNLLRETQAALRNLKSE